MEDIKCPVCGESNPSELENCQKCNQLLRPTTSELDGVGKLIDSGQTPTAKKTSELESTLPAWLKNARKGEKEEQEETPPASEEKPPSPPIEEPEAIADAAPLDWLAGLDDDDDEEEDEEAADWLVNLQGDLTPEEEVAPGIPAADEPITAGDVPRSSDEEEPPARTGELPNWVSDLQSEADEEDATPLPDLFEQESPEIPQEFVVDVGDSKSGELPDSLSDLSKESGSTSPSIETSPVQPVPLSPADADSPGIDADESLPGWMSDLQSDTVAETSSEEEVAPAVMASDEDLPDWLSDGDGASDAPPAVEEESQAQ